MFEGLPKVSMLTITELTLQHVYNHIRLYMRFPQIALFLAELSTGNFVQKSGFLAM